MTEISKVNKMISRWLVILLLFTFLFWADPVPPAGAQSDSSLTGSVFGQITDNSGRRYRQQLLLQLTDVASGEYSGRLRYAAPTRNGIIDFQGIKNGAYRLDIFFQNDLLNPDLDPTPLYSREFSVSGGLFPMETVILPETRSCARGEMFNFVNGQGRCAVIGGRRPDFSSIRIENMAFALANYQRLRSRLAPFEPSDPLKSLLRNETAKIVSANSIRPSALGDCDIACSLNLNHEIPSRPHTRSMIIGTYDRINRETGVPTRYVTEYAIAQRIARSVRHRQIASYEKFEVAVEISLGRAFAYVGAMSDFTGEEKQQIQAIVDSLVLPGDDERTSIRKVHTWVTNNISYDVKKNSYSHSAVWAYRNRMAVCDGYAYLLRYMLRSVDIDAPVVIGFAPRAHAWNKVVLDGRELFMDSTWDAGYVHRRVFYRQPSEKYFLIPQTCIAIDHYVDRKDRVIYKSRYMEENRVFMQSNCPQLLQ